MASNPFALGDWKSTECCSCGVQFASPILNERVTDKKSFWCPNGHSQRYLGEAQDETIKRLNDELAKRKSAEWEERSRADAAESRVRQLVSGKCPKCKTTFRRLREHMRRKHPKFKC